MAEFYSKAYLDNVVRRVEAKIPVACPHCSGTGRNPNAPTAIKVADCEHCKGLGMGYNLPP